jgi:plastocyanin
MKIAALISVIVVTLTVATPAAAGDIVVSQKNKAFTTKAVKAKVGDKIVFRNDDPFAHNIFSLSDTQSFDLGSFGQGGQRDITLAKEGTLEIECAIHPEMKLMVNVTK